MSLESISLVVIVYLYSSTVLVLYNMISPNKWDIIVFSLLSIIFYCLSMFGLICEEIPSREKFFKFVKSFNNKYPQFFEFINSIAAILFIINTIVHMFGGNYVFNQIIESNKYETMCYIVLSSLPIIIIYVIGTVYIIISIPFIVIVSIYAITKYVIIDTFFACRETYREVYCDTEPLNKIVKSESLIETKIE